MTKSIRSLKDVLPGVLERLGSEAQDHAVGVATGFPRLDEMTGGLRSGDLIVIGGRPSMGKTALACQFALHAAVGLRIPVAYFSTDISGETLALRLTAAASRVPLQSLRSGQLDPEDRGRVEAASHRLSRAPIYIDDAASSVGDVSTRSQCATIEYGVRLIVVDFVQAIRPYESDNRSHPLVETSTALKRLAMEVAVPIIATSQLNRRVEHRTPQYPRLSDLRGSGAIENDADVVMLMYREDLYWPHTPREGTADITIAKHRNGPTGTIWTVFQPETCVFDEIR